MMSALKSDNGFSCYSEFMSCKEEKIYIFQNCHHTLLHDLKNKDQTKEGWYEFGWHSLNSTLHLKVYKIYTDKNLCLTDIINSPVTFFFFFQK